MSITFGDMRGTLYEMPCGIGLNLTVIEQKINNRMDQYLTAHPWTRLRIDDHITAVALYNTGTISITQGDIEMVLTDGVFTAAMDGRRIRISGRNEIYAFTFTDSTHGSIDPAYEGETADTATFEIFQNIFALPAPMVELDSIEVPLLNLDMDEISSETMDETVLNRWLTGSPYWYAPAQDTTGFVRQIEVYPVPISAETYPVRGRRGVAPLQGDDEQFLPWIKTNAIQSGVEADLLDLKGDKAGSDRAEARFQVLLKDAIAEDIRRMPNALMRGANNEHRIERVTGRRGRRVINWNSAR